MTQPAVSEQATTIKTDDSEINLAKQRKHYERQLEQERQARQQAEEKAADLERKAQSYAKSASSDDDDDDAGDEPYVDHKKLNKRFAKFEKNMEATIDKRSEEKARAMVEEERRANYLKQNNDFNDVMRQENIQKFAEKYPGMAENIIKMPDGFERQKLVYEAIKALNVHKPEEKGPSIQEKVDANRRSPYYQPSGTGAPPYASAGDYSPTGQKAGYEKMKELKARLRI